MPGPATLDQVHQWLQAGESEQVEFESNLRRYDYLREVVVAFSNSRSGGYLLIGVDPHGRVFGIKGELARYGSEDSIHVALTNALRDAIVPASIDIESTFFQITGKPLLVVAVYPGPQPPYCTGDGIYVRDGARTRRAAAVETRHLRRLQARRQNRRRLRSAVSRVLTGIALASLALLVTLFGLLVWAIEDLQPRHVYRIPRPLPSSYQRIAVSPDQRLLALTNEPSSGIVLVDIRTGAQTASIKDTEAARDATFTPAGLLTYAGPGLPTFSIHKDTIQPAGPLLPEYTGVNDWPAFSADGRRIVFHSALAQPGSEESIYLAEQGHLRTLVSRPSGELGPALDISPNGRFLIYERQVNGQGDIFLRAVDGEDEQRLTSHPSSDRLPLFTPDDRFVVFLSERPGQPAIYMIRPDGQRLFCLFFATGHDVKQVALSADGKTLYFLSNRRGDWAVWEIPFRGRLIEDVWGYRYLYITARRFIDWVDQL
jgi:hypothetical protein